MTWRERVVIHVGMQLIAPCLAGAFIAFLVGRQLTARGPIVAAVLLAGVAASCAVDVKLGQFVRESLVGFVIVWLAFVSRRAHP